MADWAGLTSAQIGARIARGQTLAVLPVGATEQHGPHLPTGTDTILAERICEEACARSDVMMLPAIAYGCSYGHTQAWPGTLSLSPRLLADLICEIARWAVGGGLDRIFFISGHATNGPSIESAMLQLRHEFPKARFAVRGLWELSTQARGLYTLDGEDIHANIAETSMMMALAPDKVDLSLARDVKDLTIGRVFRYAMPATTPNGIVGRPSGATGALGEEMIHQLTDDLVRLLEQAVAEEWPDLAHL